MTFESLPAEWVVSSLKRLPSTEEAMTVGLLLLCRWGKDGSMWWKYQWMCAGGIEVAVLLTLQDANA